MRNGRPAELVTTGEASVSLYPRALDAEAVEQAADGLLRHLRRAGEGDAHPAKASFGPRRSGCASHSGGAPGSTVTLRFADRVERGRRVEALHQHDGGTAAEGDVEHHVQPEDVTGSTPKTTSPATMPSRSERP
jgi:hypothetical protein